MRHLFLGFVPAMSISLAVCLCFAACDDEAAPVATAVVGADPVADTAIAGLPFDIAREEFYDYCRGMNRAGTFYSGVGMTIGIRRADTAYEIPLDVHFSPTFTEGHLESVSGTGAAKSRSPWIPESRADSLLPVIARVLVDECGGAAPFVDLDDNATVLVKADAGRRIYLWPSAEHTTSFVILREATTDVESFLSTPPWEAGDTYAPVFTGAAQRK